MNEDLPNSQSENLILQTLNFNSSFVPPSIIQLTMHMASPLHWESPLPAIFKINFNGASKVNPRKDGFGGAIRDHSGDIIHILYNNMGLDSNNVAKLEGMIGDLMIVSRRNLLPLILEGDSELSSPWMPKFTMDH